MVIVAWPEVDGKRWAADGGNRLWDWPERTGRVCPACGARALVGHGRRQRQLHVVGLAVCLVLLLWVQRVRCGACGAVHTLVPACLGRYQRHSCRLRQRATEVREAGWSWRRVLAELGLGWMCSVTSARRWVAEVRRQMEAWGPVLARRVAVSGRPVYGPVAAPGSWAAFAAAVAEALWEAAVSWPAGEELAGAGWLVFGAAGAGVSVRPPSSHRIRYG
jgi:hypothetical protein